MTDEISDDELTALALAADPDTPLPDDAVSFWDVAELQSKPLLPGWYMPAPLALGVRTRSPWTRAIVLLLIVAFLAIDAYGLCSTYGPIVVG